MTPISQPRRPSGDEGSVLIMALAFLSLFGLAVAAVLTFAETGFRTADSVHKTTERQYAADAAIDATINAIRRNTAIGRAPYNDAACFSLPGQVNATPVSVRCTSSRPTSGATASLAGGGSFPSDAVLTLPPTTAEGVTVGSGASPVTLGNVTTRQRVTVPSGSSLSVGGTLSCAATTIAPGTVTPPLTSACPGTPSATDPAYALPSTSAPVRVTPPPCPAGAVATFVQGTYRDAAALNALMGGACTGKRFHFTPGTYYFEFAAAAPQWVINDASAEVVGGTLTAAAFPARCDLALDGVEFIFGAESRIALTAGSLELCPPLPASAAAQRVAVRGSPTSTPDQVLSPALGGATATNVPTAGYVPFTNPADAATVNGVSSSVSLSCNKCTGALALGGYPSAGVPANAIITSATMEVNHSKGQPRGDITVRVNAGDGTFGDYLVPPCVTPCATGATLSTVDVSALLSTPAKANALSAVYTAVDAPGLGALTVSVDGVAFRITYQLFGIKASSGCATTAGPYAPGSLTSCAVLRGTGGTAVRMAIKGTVYAPLAPVDLSLTGQAGPVTQRGIVSRTLWLGLTSAAGYTGPTVSLPGSGLRYVLLTASIGVVPVLRADVTIDDGLGLTPGATVTVTRWSVLR